MCEEIGFDGAVHLLHLGRKTYERGTKAAHCIRRIHAVSGDIRAGGRNHIRHHAADEAADHFMRLTGGGKARMLRPYFTQQIPKHRQGGKIVKGKKPRP